MSAEQPDKGGFTLVELLVVIAVIAILASLLLPALTRSKNAAQTIFCRNNVRQISLGVQLYLHEYDAYPRGISYENGGSYWVHTLQPYTRHDWTNKLYRCPAFDGLVFMKKGGGLAGLLGHYGNNDLWSYSSDPALTYALPGWFPDEVISGKVRIGPRCARTR